MAQGYSYAFGGMMSVCCDRCGCAVIDQAVHDNWHDQLEQR